jgi:hypothetical protein
MQKIKEQIDATIQNLKDIVGFHPTVIISQYTSIILFKNYKTETTISFEEKFTPGINHG